MKNWFKRGFLLSMMFVSLKTIGQVVNPNPTVPSPNIAPDKQSLEISSDLYNGRAQISIPIYIVEGDGIKFPIVLSYASGNGIKPDELPGWAGSGWDLTAGGYIHRTLRGKADEGRDLQTQVEHDYNMSTQVWSIKQRITLLSEDYSYFSNYNKLAQSNWNTNAYTTSDINPWTYDLANGRSGTQYRNKAWDLAPDEFTFSMCGISGKFYKNHLNKWVVQSNDGKEYTVSISTGEQTIVAWWHPVWQEMVEYKAPRIIKYLTLTSTDGIRYTFGSSDPNTTWQNQLFDFSRSSHLLDYWGYYAPRPSFSNSQKLLDIVPHTWHLSKIENLKNGSWVNLTYKQSMQYYKTRNPYAHGGTNVLGGFKLWYDNSNVYYEELNTYFSGSPLTKTATKSWILQSVNFSSGVSIDFASTLSTQLSTDIDHFDADECGFYEFMEYGYCWGISQGKSQLWKLDEVSVKYNTEIKKRIEFKYKLSASQRLQLDEIKHVSGTNSLNAYKFFYNSGQLPEYGESKTDHWGFYNNLDFFASFSVPYSFVQLRDVYPTYRAPNATYGQAEILNGIRYPTGGYAEFEYEGHTYSKSRDKYFAINSSPTNLDAGGVRIKKIKYYNYYNDENDNQLSSERTYDYSIPGSNLSSGILSAITPRYVIGDEDFYKFEVSGFNPTYYNGNHITYTYATEKENGNGKTVYEYTNFEQPGFNDEWPVSGQTNLSVDNQFPYAYKHNAFKRGKLKSISIFKEGAQTAFKQTIYHYEHENSEDNKDEIRSLYLDVINSFSAISEKRYQDRLLSENTIEHTESGSVVTNVEYSYDSYGNIKETVSSDSKNRKVRQTFKYCYEYTSIGSDAISLGIKKLNDLNIKSAVVESITIRENNDGSNKQVVGARLITYKTNEPFVDKEYSLSLSQPISLSSFIESDIDGTFIKDTRYLEPGIERRLFR